VKKKKKKADAEENTQPTKDADEITATTMDTSAEPENDDESDVHESDELPDSDDEDMSWMAGITDIYVDTGPPSALAERVLAHVAKQAPEERAKIHK